MNRNDVVWVVEQSTGVGWRPVTAGGVASPAPTVLAFGRQFEALAAAEELRRREGASRHSFRVRKYERTAS